MLGTENILFQNIWFIFWQNSFTYFQRKEQECAFIINEDTVLNIR
jgi:hypothetical protein